MYIPRNRYLSQLIAGEGNRLIKVVTGIRRSGKSFLLFQIFYDYLKQKGVDDTHIIRVDLEDIRNQSLREPMALVQYVDSRMTDREHYYILLDEVQHVTQFEDVLNSYLKIANADVYVTGSNSKFLSSDIITEFRGRGDEIHIYPLSFAEFYQEKGGEKLAAWRDYYTYGGLPQVLMLDTEAKKQHYLKNLYQTVYKKDLEERHRIGKSLEFDDLVKIMASSVGAPCNPTKLAHTFKSLAQSTISPLTIATYLEYLQEAFLIEKAQRYDVKGKKYINSLSKYYFCDLGLRNALLDFRQQEETHLMENVIYNELRMRGFSVDVGVVEVKGRGVDRTWIRKLLEVDFVANLGSKCYYIQSALAIPDEEKMQQESASLRNVKDNFKKIIIVRDYIHPWYNRDGILILSLFDFLLQPDLLDY
jgi:predicted AAA+ superfamily ATPase